LESAGVEQAEAVDADRRGFALLHHPLDRQMDSGGAQDFLGTRFDNRLGLRQPAVAERHGLGFRHALVDGMQVLARAQDGLCAEDLPDGLPLLIVGTPWLLVVAENQHAVPAHLRHDIQQADRAHDVREIRRRHAGGPQLLLLDQRTGAEEYGGPRISDHRLK
jgi:hypothetical protein